MLLVGIAAASQVHAQALVRGRVVDRAGGAVPFALIAVDGYATSLADASGAFEFSRVDPRAELHVSADGYESVRVSADTSAALRIVLDTRPLQLHEGVVVTARRQEADTFSVPGAVTVVTRRALEQKLPRTAPEALLDAPGVFVQKTNHGGGSPFVRGLVGNHVLVLVDGVRLNNATFRLGPNQYFNTIDPLSIERIEVVRGAGSVLYGTDAIGGVVHVVTRTPTPRGGDWYLEARTSARGASGTPERSGRVELEGGRGAVAWLGGVSVKAFGDLRAGGDLGVRAPSSYDEADVDLKVRWQPADSRSLTLSVQRVRQKDVGRFDQVAQRGFETWSFDPQARSMAMASYVQRMKSGPIERLSFTAAVQRTDEVRRWRRAGTRTDVSEEDVVGVVSGSADLQWRPIGGWRITSGIDVTADRVDSRTHETSRESSASVSRRGLYADDASARSWAAFTQARRAFGIVELEGGARYAASVVEASAPVFGTFTLRSDAVVGQAGISVAATDALRPYAQVWQGFRAPNIDDVSALGSFDFGMEVPTTDLSPESSLGAEGGVKWREGRWAASAAVYRLGLRDLIERVRGTYFGESRIDGQAVYVRDNVGTAYVRGVEIETELELSDSLRLQAWLTQTYGQQVSRNEPMRRIPPVHGLVGLSWSPPGARTWAEVRWRVAGRQDRLASGDRADHRIDPNGTPSWSALGLNGGWRMREGVDLVGGVDNLLDAPYRIHGSGIDGAGRTWWVGTHVRLF